MGSRAPVRTLLGYYGDQVRSFRRVGIPGGRSQENKTARRKLLEEQCQENAPLRKLSAEGSHVNMAVRRMLPENHGS